ncbi:hypothetical protein Q8A67_000818 [Cirrhinus molitorella]|uniref:Uncharacterized protein n=1 Tax=Cirrhinus molitorella TaxID=172907 RepID=A0AA88QPJ1_9TELE|nr:hypothetical protein Q8A67_000818 [Cirrhinus molitorella]
MRTLWMKGRTSPSSLLSNPMLRPLRNTLLVVVFSAGGGCRGYMLKGTDKIISACWPAQHYGTLHVSCPSVY